MLLSVSTSLNKLIQVDIIYYDEENIFGDFIE